MTDLRERTRFEPAEVEPRIVEALAGVRACSTPSRRATPAENYSIAIPPPNVTGALHMGHALNGSIQDTLIRWHRMRGHAHEVDPRHRPRRHRHADAGREAAARAEGTSREEIGREAFVERVWEWREQYGGTIIEQFKRLGASLRLRRRALHARRGATSRAVHEGLRRALRQGPRSTATTTWSTGTRARARRSRDLEVEDREVDRHALPHRLPARGRLGRGRGRDRAPGDDARRHRGRGEPRRRALPRT